MVSVCVKKRISRHKLYWRQNEKDTYYGAAWLCYVFWRRLHGHCKVQLCSGLEVADIAAAAGKDHTGTVRQIQHIDCEIKNPGTRGELIPGNTRR